MQFLIEAGASTPRSARLFQLSLHTGALQFGDMAGMQP
jgi:hypothetical protein